MATPPRDPSDTLLLLQQVRTGDRYALDRLLESHRPYLCLLVNLRLDDRVRGRVDPSDVVQETQLEAVRRLNDYLHKPTLPFRLWLRQIAQDRMVMLHRRHVEASRRTTSRDVPLPASPQVLPLADPRPSPEEQAARQELVQRVWQTLAELAEPDREVILMRNYEGLSNQEIAQLLGLEPATASRRYGRALLRLRQLLAARGFPELT